MGARVFGAKVLIPPLFLVGLPASGTVQVTSQALAATNPIVTENQQPGTCAWLIGALQADDVNGQIKGYASATSVLQGQPIDLFVTVNPPQTYTMDVFRVRWYGAVGGREALR